ncbi:MAG: BMP family protein [Acidimicrobiales bacterium]
MKRLLALLAALALLMAACGSGSDATSDDAASDDSASDDSASDDGGSAETFKVAIVAPSASNDLAFSQSMVDAVNSLKDSENLEIAITDGTFVVDDAAAALRGYADDGFDLVIAHGTQFGGPLEEIAKDFPETAFAWGTSDDNKGAANVSAYTVRSDEGGYVNGIMAANLSESKVIGVVGPVPAGDALLYIDGFVNGVAAGDPSATVNVNYIESFSDVALAAEAAEAHIANNADVLTGTAQMVVGATGVAKSNSVPWFGTQSNQTSLGEEIVVASQVYHWEVVLVDIIAGVRDGKLGGEVYTLTLENGGLEIEFNDAFGLDPAIKEAGEAAVAGLKDGSVSTGL